ATSSFSVGAAAPTPSSSSQGQGVGATVEWSPIPGAVSYEIAWATSSSFSGATVKETRQTAYHIPSSTPGNFVWRVRAKIGDDAYGSWSAARSVRILSPTRIPIGVSRGTVNSRSIAIIEGQLIVAGSTRNGQRVYLERKNATCNENG